MFVDFPISLIQLLQKNFFDPPLTSDGKPYAPERYRAIVQEKYIIAKQSNISYEDTSSMSPAERRYILEFIRDDLKRQQDAIERAKQHNKR